MQTRTDDAGWRKQVTVLKLFWLNILQRRDEWWRDELHRDTPVMDRVIPWIEKMCEEK